MLHMLLAELAQKFKLLQNSCMTKWFHKTELRGILPLNAQAYSAKYQGIVLLTSDITVASATTLATYDFNNLITYTIIIQNI